MRASYAGKLAKLGHLLGPILARRHKVTGFNVPEAPDLLGDTGYL
jgi:hypothetical protein